MTKIGIVITDDMDKALKRQNKKTGVPVAEFVRRAIARELKRAGEKVEWDVAWGGYREPGDIQTAGNDTQKEMTAALGT